MCCARFDVAVFELVRLSCLGAAVSDPPLYVMPCKQWVSRNSSVYRGIFFFFFNLVGIYQHLLCSGPM